MRARIFEAPGVLPLLLFLLAAPLHGQGGQHPRVSVVPLRAAARTEAVSAYELRQSWYSRDKIYHFGVSAAGSFGLYAGGRRLGLSRGQALAGAGLVMGAAGVWREVGTSDPHDRLTRGKLSRRDLVWDAVGIAAGLAVADRWLGAPRRAADEAPPSPAVPPPPGPAAESPDGAAEGPGSRAGASPPGT